MRGKRRRLNLAATGLLGILLPCLTLVGGCAMRHRGADAPYTSHQETIPGFGEGGEEPSSIAGWEERQLRHSEALAMAAGHPLRPAPQDPGAPPPQEPRPAQGVPSEASDAPQAHERPSQPSPAAQPAPLLQSDRQRVERVHRRTCRSCRSDRDRGPTRCQRICRHLEAICRAASRICQLAHQMNDPEALNACRRSEARCAEARSIAHKTCPRCPRP